MHSHYETLGVERNASQDDIKKAYRKLVKKHHPDHGGDENEFKKISAAYSVIGDPDKRKRYDNPDPFFEGSGPGSPFGFGFARPKPQKPDLNAPRDGSFIGVEVEIPLKTYIFGGEFVLTTSFNEGCKDCGGKGFQAGEECDLCNGEGYVHQEIRRPGFVSSATRPCGKCQGLGQISDYKCEVCGGVGNNQVKDRKIRFDVPPGAGIGAKIISHGTGRAGLNGGRDGDVGILISGIKRPDLNNMTQEQLYELKKLLEALDNGTKSA